jgi:hypothetical protein
MTRPEETTMTKTKIRPKRSREIALLPVTHPAPREPGPIMAGYGPTITYLQISVSYSDGSKLFGGPRERSGYYCLMAVVTHQRSPSGGTMVGHTLFRGGKFLVAEATRFNAASLERAAAAATTHPMFEEVKRKVATENDIVLADAVPA